MCADNRDSASFQDWVKQALLHFHDRAWLTTSPLAAWQIVRGRMASPDRSIGSLAAGQAFQELLSDAIQALKPTAPKSLSSPAWRAFQILDLAFREEIPVARILEAHLHLSRSQYYRELAGAIAAVAHLLQEWERAAELGEDEGTAGSSSRWIDRLPPPTYSRLFGVDAEAAAIVEALLDRHSRWLMVVDGIGGAGKTAVARHAACRALQDDRWAGLAWETAQRKVFSWGEIRPVDRPALTAGRLLDSIAQQIELPLLSHLPADEKRRALHAALHRAPYLVVVDNLETAVDYEAVAEELWALTQPTKVLVTSRYRLERYDPATSVHLHALDQEPGYAFIRCHAEERSITPVLDAGDAAVDRLWKATGGNPLAIKLVIGQAAARPLDRVLGDLEEANGSTGLLYRYIYQAAWQMLSLPARQLLLSMPHLSTVGGRWEALEAISGLAGEPLAAAVDELAALSLLDVTGRPDRRYSIHQLTCNFVVSSLVGLIDASPEDNGDPA